MLYSVVCIVLTLIIIGPIEEGKFHKIHLTLQTTGGNCKSLVKESLQLLFLMINLPHNFQWDEEYWVMENIFLIL